MENIVASTFHSINGGCFNTAGGDCHWRREYKLLKKQFDEYRTSVDSKVEKLIKSHEKMQNITVDAARIKCLVNAAVVQEKTKQKIREEITEAFQKGYDEARRESKFVNEYRHNLQVSAESDFMRAQNKIYLLEKEKEEMVAEHAKNINAIRESHLEIEKKNMALQENLDCIKAEAIETISAYAEMKREAVESYEEICEEYVKLQESCLEHCQSLEKKYESAKKECQLLVLKSAEHEKNIHKQAQESEKKLQETRRFCADLQVEIIKQFDVQFSWISSQFHVLSDELNSAVLQVAEVIQGELKTSLKDDIAIEELNRTFLQVYKLLVRVQGERAEVVEKKEKVEKELESVTGTLKELNQQTYEYIEATGSLLQELIKFTGLPMDIKSSKIFQFFGLQKLSGEIIDKTFSDLPTLMVQLKREESVAKILLQEIKVCKNKLDSDMVRLRDRQTQLEQQLQEERILRSKENELASEKIRVYKRLITKLRLRIEKAIKMAQMKCAPKTKFFTEYENLAAEAEMEIQSFESFQCFKIILLRAEKVVETIETKEYV